MSSRILNQCICFALFAVAAISGGLVLAPEARALDLNPEIERVEKSLENRIQENIATFFGKDTPVIVTVHLKEGGSTRVKAGSGVDVLYAPVPFVNSFDRTVDAQQRLTILNVDVDVQVGAEVDEQTLAAAKSVIEKILKGYKATISVTKVSMPSRPVAAPAPQESALARTLTPEVRALLPLLGSILAALIVTLGIVFIAQSLRTSAQAVAREFSRVAPPAHVPASAEPLPIAAAGPDSAAFLAGASSEPLAARNFERNLGIVRETLAQNPMVFLRTINDGEEDLRGLKWILPSLTREEKETVRHYIGASGIQRLVLLDRMSGNPDQSPWLQEFVERLVLRKIEERTLVEKAIGAEKAGKLYLVEPKYLLAAVRALNTPAAWRILSEFLPKEHLDRVVGEMSSQQWKPLFQAAQLDAASLASAVDEILSRLEKIPGELTEADERASFYTKTLLDPVLKSLERKAIGEEEAFIRQVSAEAPELAQLVRERFWTAENLSRVPDDAIMPLLSEMRNEQRLGLLLALPPEHAERIKGLLPPGNVRTIVQDQLNQALARREAGEYRAACATTRQFLEELRKQYTQGKFPLLPPHTAAERHAA